ncbi:hypothetical protein POM88_006010 [Heracleum sosnowskyi]|uniref:Uncharacterized protein n=1 Tax=Heracleum sosnowskyi TaxID=360622 RepID=A0AAD8J558_9APIA|nr:hypothetical protein POM88_006010 [Heracleum sosnowskyi]
MDFGVRRSSRTRKDAVLDFQEQGPTKKRALRKCKTYVKEQQDDKEEEHQQLQQQEDPQGYSEERKPEEEPHKEDHQFVTRPPAKSDEHQQIQEEEPQEEIDHRSVTLPLEKSEEHQEEEEDPSVTLPPGHEVEDEVAGTGSLDLIPVDISSSPEERKPQADPLSLLQPVFKSNYQVKFPQESLKVMMDAAVVFKSALVSHLENLVPSLDIATMVQSANECFERMRGLGVDYQTFHGQISRLIEYYQKLKEFTEVKNLELEAAYEVSVIEADDAKNELHRAENDLLSAQTNNNLTSKRIKELKESLGQLKAQDDMERSRIVTLTAERDHRREANSCSLRKVDRLYSECEGNKKREDATREEIQRQLSRLRGLE